MLFSSQSVKLCDETNECDTKVVQGFESYNMGLFVLYYATFGYDVDREVKSILLMK